ncbi:MAG: hypothetical protein WC222_01235 [Parachlamydiales bacterium]|jgi:hypothetical protein
MLINREVLSIPPHISTSWGHVIALHMQDENLMVYLTDGIIVQIPNLPDSLLEQIFSVHAAYLGEQTPKRQLRPIKNELDGMTATEFPLRLGFGSMENMMASSMQHNPEQAHMPDLPSEIIDKIATIAKVVSPREVSSLPKGEPHCNCMFCQVSRAIHRHAHVDEPEIVTEHKVAELPLSATDPWIVEPNENNCYNVHHRESPIEQYKVFIKDGEIGCNCGNHGCEHIIAVLRS